MKFYLALMAFTFSTQSSLASDLWQEGAAQPVDGITNPYQLSNREFELSVQKGFLHAQQYPVIVTGVLLPERPLKNTFGERFFSGLFRWLGLQPYPSKKSDPNWPVPDQIDPEKDLIGYSRIQKNGVSTFTISCAVCHSSQLFGKVVLGMTNRFPRANHFFIRGQKASQLYNPHFSRVMLKSTKEENEIFLETKNNLNSVGLKMPLQLGLDTSLAQVALSLNKRNLDPWAQKNAFYEKHPRPDALDTTPADSKPAVWWNVKYKNRWLLDGSVISGNPILTNILWNEIGRGTDLKILDRWLIENQAVVQELTNAVYSSKAPRIEEFFTAEKIERSRALRGEALFNQMCSKCHGEYIKNWSKPELSHLAWRDQIKNYEVKYFDKTPVKDVGTDPLRFQMMKSLEKLNDLELSVKNGIKIKAQTGYVPPPLEGIWARYPYMHNNSIPSLCAVLTPAELRPKTYYAGAALNPNTDYDFECGGYPSGKKVPKTWQKRELFYDTQRPGMRNTGHDKRIFIKDGVNVLSSSDRSDLIQYLLTL